MKKVLLACFIIFLAQQGFSQEYRITKGGVTDSLQFPGNLDETFAVYMPSNYSTDKKWPLIFVFDPEGRGASAANLFRYAAEDQGYLIASANFSLKSEPVDSLGAKALNMMQTLFNSFPIDQNQVYAAGLSEGGQIAGALPIFYKSMAGVMSIGNTWLNEKEVRSGNRYMFIGVAGKKDYMIYVLEDYLKFYDKNNFPTEAVYFEGDEDQWPSADVITNAVTGFSLNAIKNGNRPNEKAFVQRLFDIEMGYAETLRRKREFYSAYQKLEQMEEKYEDLGFEDQIDAKMDEIKEDQAFRDQRRNFNRAVSYEREKQDEFEYLLNLDMVTKNFDNIGWWAYQIDELNKLKESTDQAQSNMAYRLHSYIDFITKREMNAIKGTNAPIDNKVFVNVLRTAIRKDDPEAYFNIIRLAGGDNDYGTALLYLEDLLKTGYSDMESLYEIPNILDLKLTKEYNQLIKKYLGTSKYYNESELEEKTEVNIQH